MDFKSLLQSMTTLSEGETKETSKGREHKGTYGTSHGKEDVRDQYGHKIGRVDKDKDDKAKKDDAPKKRGRPTKAAKDETGADIKHDTSGIQSMLGKKPSKEVGKVSKKHSLKEYIEEVETNIQLDEDMNNQDPIQIKPASQTNTQVIQQGNKTLGTVTNPQLAAQIKQSIGKGEMTLNPDEQGMAEDGGEKWIQKAIKHPGALTRKAQAAGQSTSAFAKSHAHDKGTTGKQARLAQTLSKMRESLQANGMVLTEGQKEQMTKFFDELELGPKGYNIKAAVELHDKGLATSIINKTLAHGRFRSMAGTYKDQMRDAALEHFGFTNYEESLEEGDLIPHPSKDMYRQHAIQNGKDLKVGDISAFKPSRIQAPSRPVEEPTPWKVDPINAATDRAINFISGLRKPKNTLESKEDMKDVQFEGWENQLKSMLTEGITVSSSTGQQGSPDNVTISASDTDAEQLLGVLRNAGIGVFGGNQKAEMTPYGAPAGEEEPTGTGTEPEMSPDVVGDGDDMLSLIKKMTGLSAGPVGQEPEGTASCDYEDEEGSDDTALQPAGGEEGHDDAEDSDEEDSDEEEKTDEGYNAFTSKVAKAKSDNIPDKNQKISVGGKQYPVKEDDMEESNAFVDKLRKTPKGEKFSIGGKQYTDTSNIEEGHDHEMCNECGGMMYEGHTCEEQMNEGMGNEYSPEMQERIKNSTPQELSKMAYELAGDPSRYSHEYKKLEATRSLLRGTTKHEESVGEGFSNDAGGDAMADTELMKLKELLSMGGDLHKLKRSQAVGNPTQVTLETKLMKDSSDLLVDYKRLSGIK
jgi:hypothetical protein